MTIQQMAWDIRDKKKEVFLTCPLRAFWELESRSVKVAMVKR